MSLDKIIPQLFKVQKRIVQANPSNMDGCVYEQEQYVDKLLGDVEVLFSRIDEAYVSNALCGAHFEDLAPAMKAVGDYLVAVSDGSSKMDSAAIDAYEQTVKCYNKGSKLTGKNERAQAIDGILSLHTRVSVDKGVEALGFAEKNAGSFDQYCRVADSILLIAAKAAETLPETVFDRLESLRKQFDVQIVTDDRKNPDIKKTCENYLQLVKDKVQELEPVMFLGNVTKGFVEDLSRMQSKFQPSKSTLG